MPIPSFTSARQLRDWLLAHWNFSVVPVGPSGDKKKLVDALLKEYEEKGKFTGQCADFAPLFAYLCLKNNLCNPTIALLKVDGTYHEATFAAENGVVVVGYDIPGKKQLSEAWMGPSAVLASEVFGFGTTKSDDSSLFKLIFGEGYIPNDGESLAIAWEKVKSMKAPAPTPAPKTERPKSFWEEWLEKTSEEMEKYACSREDFFNLLGSLKGTVQKKEVTIDGQKYILEIDYTVLPVEVRGTTYTGKNNPPPPKSESEMISDWKRGKSYNRMYCPKDDTWYWVAFPVRLTPVSPPPTPVPARELEQEEYVPAWYYLSVRGSLPSQDIIQKWYNYELSHGLTRTWEKYAKGAGYPTPTPSAIAPPKVSTVSTALIIGAGLLLAVVIALFIIRR